MNIENYLTAKIDGYSVLYDVLSTNAMIYVHNHRNWGNVPFDTLTNDLKKSYPIDTVIISDNPKKLYEFAVNSLTHYVKTKMAEPDADITRIHNIAIESYENLLAAIFEDFGETYDELVYDMMREYNDMCNDTYKKAITQYTTNFNYS